MQSTLSTLFEKTCRESLADKMESMSLLYSVFSLLAENRTCLSRNAYVARALDHISQHYAEALSVQDMAAMLHLNTSYFSRLFKAETGLPPVRFITTFRVKMEYFACGKRTGLPPREAVLSVFRRRRGQARLNFSLPCLQRGHFQSSGSVSNAAPSCSAGS